MIRVCTNILKRLRDLLTWVSLVQILIGRSESKLRCCVAVGDPDPLTNSGPDPLKYLKFWVWILDCSMRIWANSAHVEFHITSLVHADSDRTVHIQIKKNACKIKKLFWKKFNTIWCNYFCVGGRIREKRRWGFGTGNWQWNWC